MVVIKGYLKAGLKFVKHVLISWAKHGNCNSTCACVSMKSVQQISDFVNLEAWAQYALKSLHWLLDDMLYRKWLYRTLQSHGVRVTGKLVCCKSWVYYMSVTCKPNGLGGTITDYEHVYKTGMLLCYNQMYHMSRK